MLEAIEISSHDGAQYEGMLDHSSIAVGKAADLVVLEGDPKDIINIETVELVFKDGIGYDPVKLVESVAGMVGVR